MIEISQEDFESKIQEVIEGKTTRANLIIELKTDSRTLNNRIQELSAYNPDLYLSFIKKYPYESRGRDDIDYEALIIEIIKGGLYTVDAARKYHLGIRTIQRRVNDIEKENPDLIAIYKEIKRNNKNNIPASPKLEEKIAQLVERPVKIGEINETRKKQLEELEAIFNKRCEYVSKEDAAKSMGTTAAGIYKALNILYRIKIEEAHRKKVQSEKLTFKESLKVSSSITTTKSDANGEDILPKQNNSVIGKGIGEE